LKEAANDENYVYKTEKISVRAREAKYERYYGPGRRPLAYLL